MTEQHDSEVTTFDDEDDLDPSTAAHLLQKTSDLAKREFDTDSMAVSFIGGLIVVLAYGAIWLSVRGQRPYVGPNGWVLLVVYGLIAVALIANRTSFKRATEGMTGPTLRRYRGAIATVVVADIAVYVFMGALRYDGVGDGIVYGVYPATAPLIVLGAVSAIYSATQENWTRTATSLAIVAVGAISAFFGPTGVWGVAGVGCFVAVYSGAAMKLWMRRR